MFLMYELGVTYFYVQYYFSRSMCQMQIKYILIIIIKFRKLLAWLILQYKTKQGKKDFLHSQ